MVKAKTLISTMDTTAKPAVFQKALPKLGRSLGKTLGGTAAHGQTMAFMVLAMSQVLHAFHMRSDKSLFKIGAFGNRTLNLAALASLALVALILFTPGVMTAFGLVYLTGELYLMAAGLILAPSVIMELCKLVGLIK